MDELQLPHEKDTLFKTYNTDYTQNAVIKSGENAFLLYSEGYKNAALKLWHEFDGSASEANTIVYPLIFLNRHFIELRLKELIGCLNLILIQSFSFPQVHDLQKLWDCYKIKLEELEENYKPSKQELLAVGNLIEEFNIVDPNSYSRYSLDKNLNPTLKIASIDLEHFMTTMIKLFNFFDLATDVTYCLKDQTEEYSNTMLEEMLSHYGSYY